MKTILTVAAVSTLFVSAASARPYYVGPDAGYLTQYGVYDAMNYPPEAARRSNLNPRDPAYTGGDTGGDDYYFDPTMR